MPRTSKKAAADKAAVDAGSVTDAGATTLVASTPDSATLEPIARQALGEITRPANVGALRDIVVADDVATVRFSTTQGGYPGWYWTVAVAVNPGMAPSVLETELIPAEGALTAPDWVPWADRLDDYLAQQAHERELAGELDDDDDGDDDDDDSDDEHDELDEIDGGHLADDEARALGDDDDDDDDDDDHADEHDLHRDDHFDGVDIDLHLDDEPLAPA